MQIEVNSAKHKALHVLSVNGIATLHQLMVQCRVNHMRVDVFEEDEMKPLTRAGLVTRNGHHFAPTFEGRKRATELRQQQDQPQVPMTPGTLVPRFTKTLYDGKELGRTSNREGAYDYKDKPSIFNGRPV